MLWAKWGSFLMFMGVTLGAFGAHTLKAKLSEYQLDIYKTAVLYHLFHALGLFAVAWLSSVSSDVKIFWAGICILLGVILFCGSLYALALTGHKWLGAITPLGGLSFLTGWLFFFLSLFRAP